MVVTLYDTKTRIGFLSLVHYVDSKSNQTKSKRVEIFSRSAQL